MQMIKQYPMSWEAAVTWLKAQPDKAEVVRQCFYDDPIDESANRFYAGIEWTAVRNELPQRTGAALEIGAGRGISSFALAKDGWDVTALEPDTGDEVGSGVIRALAAQTKTPIKIVNDWGESLPFASNAFELVYCRAVLHHARDLTRLCAEINRVLKPGGYFLATREHVISDSDDLDIFLNNHPLHHLYGGENAYRLRQYREAIQGSGLSLVKTMNPFESDINLFPDSKESAKARISRKLKIIPQSLIPDLALKIAGHYDRTPGRLYSFLAKKEG